MVEIILNQVFAAKAAQSEQVKSLQRLVELAANTDTGGGRVAARVILSCYNGEDYPLDVCELGTLDAQHFEDALNVIRLRIQDGKEPHEFFTDGGRLFNQIADAWNMRPAHFEPINAPSREI